MLLNWDDSRFYWLITSWIPYALRLSQLQTNTTLNIPGTCVAQATTLQTFVSCHLQHVVQREYTQESYDEAQPTDVERGAWSMAVSSLLNANGNCSSITVALPEPLRGIYSVSELVEPSGSSFCVLAENIEAGRDEYKKGWGFLAVPSTRAAVSRHIHISAPHPLYDRGTELQAATAFQGIGAKSLYVPGRIRLAYPEPTSCIPPTARSIYYKTDPAHDKNELFFDTSKQLIEWQNVNGGCPSSACAYIQFHGKSGSTCQTDQVFTSTGLGREPDALDWYTNVIDYPIKRIKSQLSAIFPTWNVTLPSDGGCALTATKNIVGRLINGVSEDAVCSRAARAQDTQGQFVHLEQAATSRAMDSYQGWVQALQNSFDTSCAPGMKMNRGSGLCA
ncbi:hypothetical protein AX17_003759 [Amanita inopinata Kibby_2008]|nr:hypothetical protein AX17_003759 [Amanita inopinata Kibby_2008]